MGTKIRLNTMLKNALVDCLTIFPYYNLNELSEITERNPQELEAILNGAEMSESEAVNTILALDENTNCLSESQYDELKNIIWEVF